MASDRVNLYGVPLGVDFPVALVDGTERLFENAQPQDWARATLILNTTRMARRVRKIFNVGPPRLLPRILLLGEVEQLLRGSVPPPPASSLRRRLSLARLIQQLMEQRREFAARDSAFDLADSLAALMDEMQGEGVPPETIANLDVSDHSDHFAQTQAFLSIVETYLQTSAMAPDSEARQRDIVLRLIAEWDQRPPDHLIILAGSTGSRGTTALLAEAIAKLPRGHVVLPGFDTDLPAHVWASLGADQSLKLPAEDHPQYRLYHLCARLGVDPNELPEWSKLPAIDPLRNRLVSLALRPAPVTDAWRTEGPGLGDLQTATKALTLVEAESPRAEALAIALRLRLAAEQRQKAALISPDRMLTRQVAAALDAWNILPDDSAGTPLHLTPIGRFLRHVADLFLRPLTSEALLTLLKHPQTHRGADRSEHLLNTRRFELYLRDQGMPFPSIDSLTKASMALQKRHGEEIAQWMDWVAQTFCGLETKATQQIDDWVKQHIVLASRISRSDQALWDHNSGRVAKSVFEGLSSETDSGDTLSVHEYVSLIGHLLTKEEVREAESPYPGIMIWGTMEARVQGADLVILGGLNDGTWPEQPAPDPWLNRSLRHAAGLMLPDRRIGLSAHDFQQAIAAKDVWLSRALRNSDAETVPSRWLNRMLNLLSGLSGNSGPEAVANMRQRGNIWLAKAKVYEEPIQSEKAHRPSPQPPVAARPRELSVSEVRTLIRDPYAVYAKHCLHLKPLGPLVPQADALVRGIALHQVLEDFVKASLQADGMLKSETLLQIGEAVLSETVPWPAARALWLARLDRVADWFVQGEIVRQSAAQPVAFEDKATGKLDLPDLGMQIRARADRIDATLTGELVIYDYKTGSPPSQKQQRHFDRQLLLEATMAEQGGFDELGPHTVYAARYIGVGTTPTIVDAPLQEEPPAKVLEELRALLGSYLSDEQGYTARRAHLTERDVGDYDVLARFGEWESNASPVKERVG